MKNRIETKVIELLQKHSVTDAPVPVERIANAEGLAIITTTTYGGEVSGALIRSNGVVGIAVNSAHHPNRQRFTVAHELAHYLLGHQGEYVDRDFTVLRRDLRSSEASDYAEIEANAFAASLLMPREFLIRDLRIDFRGEIDVPEEQMTALARKYKVSRTALNYRLINLGLLSPVWEP